jgi:hypothetical protein
MTSHGPGGLRAFLVAVPATLGVLAMTSTAFAATPANDNVANAQAIPTAGGTISGTNVGATAEAGEPRRVDFLDRSASTVWYRWTSPGQPAQLNVDGCQGANFHMKIGLYKKTADPVPPFTNLADWGAIGEDPTEPQSCPTEYGVAGYFTPDACSTYYIQVSGFAATAPPDGDRGPFTLALSGGGSGACGGASAPPPPPVTSKKKGGAKHCKKAKKGVASAAKRKKCK